MSDPVQEIARQLHITTFGDGLMAKIRLTIDLLQEAANERDQLRAELEQQRGGVVLEACEAPGECVAVPRDVLLDLLDEGPRSKTWDAQDKLRAILAQQGKENSDE